jgi:ribosomal protein S6--L-glutamate ligase
MVLSFHPHIHGDVNLRLPHKSPLSPEVEKLAASARAIICTQHIKPNQYAQLAAVGTRLFPNYTCRFGFEGKVGNARLFQQFRAPHPETRIYGSVEDFERRHFSAHEPLFDFPFVLKGDRGGGGWAVFLSRNMEALKKNLDILRDVHLHPTKQFVAQTFVEHQGRDLRVVVLGDRTTAYWRCQQKPEEFRNNVGRGATIHFSLDPELQKAGVACVKNFCKKTGINLAAFDVLFDRKHPHPSPLLSEINFLFGRKGLGGSPQFHKLLKVAVMAWLAKL